MIISSLLFYLLCLSGPHLSEMIGVDEKVVTVKNLLEGNYVFKLTVTDEKGLTGTDTVAVNVKKGEQIASDVTTSLHTVKSRTEVYAMRRSHAIFNKSHEMSQTGVTHFCREKFWPRSSDAIFGKIAQLSTLIKQKHFVRPVKLNENPCRFMVFLLWYFSISDINKAPTANGGPDVLVYLPNRAVELDGSQSYDDHGIVEYEWSRDPKSPAAGVSGMSCNLSQLRHEVQESDVIA